MKIEPKQEKATCNYGEENATEGMLYIGGRGAGW